MRADSIGPQTGKSDLFLAALLKQQLVPIVEEEKREGSMRHISLTAFALKMTIELGDAADDIVL